MQVKIKRLSKHAVLPEYKTPGAAAMDLCSIEQVILRPGTRAMVSTGLAIALPEGYEAQIRARSGLASKGIIVLNGPGTIDSDYRGEIKILLANLGNLTIEQDRDNATLFHHWDKPTPPNGTHKPECLIIKPGDRIAQMVIAPVLQVGLEEVDELDETQRGVGGFGSTGVR